MTRRRLLSAARRRLPVLAALALGLSGGGCGSSSPVQRPLELFVTGDTQGWITPCGCTSNQAGGLARRAGFIAQRGAAAETIVADVGGAPGGTSPYDRCKFAAILRGEVVMGLAAHNLGAAEAALGAAELQRLADDTQAPFVSANLLAADGRPLAEPLRIVGTARRVALVGVVSPRLVAKPLQTREPRAAVRQALDAARGRFDLAVVLAYVPADELREMAKSLPEVDVVVGGPTGQSVPPERSGPALVTAVTSKGKFLAHLTAPSGRGAAWQGEIVELDRRIPDDPRQVENLRRFRRELAERDFAADETGFVAAPATADSDFHLVGVQACQQCHATDCRAWETSGHHQAWSTLARSDAQSDSYCQQCHTTGYGLAGGFVSALRSADRVSVGCESCHGPGAAHVRAPRTAMPFAAADQCQRCHDLENSPQFAYDTYWPRIEHGQPAQVTAGARPSDTQVKQ